MPSEIIKKLINAENQAEEREKLAHIEAKSIVSNAKIRAQEIIKNAESESENMLLNAESNAYIDIDKFKNVRKTQLENKIKKLKKSAESNSESAAEELLKALI